MVPAVAFGEFFISVLVCKQRLHTFHFKFHFDFGRKLAHYGFHGIGNIFFGIQSRADGSKKVGVVHINDMLLV